MNTWFTIDRKNIKLLFIIILFQIIFLLYFMNSKICFFCDEIYSYSLSNSQYGHIFPPAGHNTNMIVTDKWISGDILKKHICVTEKTKFNFTLADLNNFNDSHPPFYNYLLHLICSFFPNSFSKWYGFSLNILFFIISEIFLYLISIKVFKSENLALITCIIYGFSAGSIDCYLLIRVYSLLTMLYLILMYLYISYFEKESLINIFFIIIVATLGGLTHYHFYVYAFFLVLTFGLHYLINKKFKLFCLISLSPLLGICISYIYFPYFFIQFKNSPRGTEALDFYHRVSPFIIGLSSAIEEFLGLKSSVAFYLTFLFVVVFSVFLIIIIINHYYKDNIVLKFVTIIAFAYSLVIYHTLDYAFLGFYTSGRFLFPIIPMFAIIIVAILYRIKNIFLSCFICLLCFLSSFFMLDFYYPYSDNGYFGYLKLENIFKGNNIIIKCRNNEILESLCPLLYSANRVYIVSDNKSVNQVIKSCPNYGHNYLILYYLSKKDQINYKKIVDGYIWNNDIKYEVYDLGKQ